MNRQDLSSFLQELTEQYPGIEIMDREEDRLIYAHGCYPVEYKWILQGPYKYLPSLILVPGTTEDVSGIMRLSEKYGIGIIPFGGGSGIVGGSIPENEEVMVDVKRTIV